MAEAMARKKGCRWNSKSGWKRTRRSVRRLGELEKEKGLLLERIEEAKAKAAATEEEVAMVEARAKNRQDLLKQIKEAFEEAREPGFTQECRRK
jgi:glycine cleavage system regulatory protein